jgi:Mg-chelatase subunit ChlI
MEKLRPQTRDCLLDALNSERIKPDQLRYTYPAHALIVGTTNDHTKFSGAINDRMAMLAVRYPEDVETSYSITRRGYHGEGGLEALVQAIDPHLEQGFWLRRVPMPVIFEQAVDALYMKFRASYQHKTSSAITASNRSKFDALDAARAKLMIDQLFDPDVPAIVDRERTMYGVKYAFHACARHGGITGPQEQGRVGRLGR